jgi:hypothetical protein
MDTTRLQELVIGHVIVDIINQGIRVWQILPMETELETVVLETLVAWVNIALVVSSIPVIQNRRIRTIRLLEHVIGHVIVTTYKLATAVFLGIKNRFYSREKAPDLGLFLAKNSIALYYASRSEYERSTCSHLRCVLSFH